MSLFLYECSVCGEPYEAIVPLGAATDAACPRCEQRRVRTLLSRLSLQPLRHRTADPCCERSWFGDCGKGGGFR